MGSAYDLVCINHNVGVRGTRRFHALAVSFLNKNEPRESFDNYCEGLRNIFDLDKNQLIYLIAFTLEHINCETYALNDSYDTLSEEFHWTEKEYKEADEWEHRTGKKYQEFFAKLIKEGHPNKKRFEELKRIDPSRAKALMIEPNIKWIFDLDCSSEIPPGKDSTTKWKEYLRKK
jgi:hypothetical protein